MSSAFNPPPSGAGPKNDGSKLSISQSKPAVGMKPRGQGVVAPGTYSSEINHPLNDTSTNINSERPSNPGHQ